MILSDNDGEISAKLWDYNENTHGKFETDMFVKVRGTISQYNGADQLRVEKMRKVTPEDNVVLPIMSGTRGTPANICIIRSRRQ